MSLHIGTDEEPEHWHDQPGGDVGHRLNALRAAVLGANDGIVSTAGLVMGVAGATSDRSTLVVSGLAALVAGALSMGAGEYVSVSTQRDSERSMLALEAAELQAMPRTELDELARLYEEKGLTAETAREVAVQLTAHDALAAHAEAEFGVTPGDLSNPWQAAGASVLSFSLGALLPLLTIALCPASARVAVTVVVVAMALALTGFLSARLGLSPVGRAMARNVVGGLLAMAVTYAVGTVAGTHLG